MKRCVLLAALPALAACHGVTAGSAADEVVVARWQGHALSGGDLVLAWRQSTPLPGAAPAKGHVEALVRDVLVEEELAREAAALPGAATRAALGRQQAAVQELLRRQVAVTPVRLEAWYREHEAEFRVPNEIRLSTLRFGSCDAAAAALAAIEQGRLSFEAAALESVDAAAGSAPPVWQPLDRLDPPVREAALALGAPGALSPPTEVEQGCVILQLVERRAGRDRTFAEVRGEVESKVEAAALASARRALVQRLGGTAVATVDEARLTALVAGDPGVDARAAVVSLGEERVTAGDVRAALGAVRTPGPGGVKALGARFAEELLLRREARRLGLDRSAAARAAARSVLVREAHAARPAAITAASIAADEVRAIYESSQGDYTIRPRVRVAALVSRDQKRAARWAATLRAARFPADAFAKLVGESEETAARLRGGDLGWVDDHSTHLPESFRQASLLLPRPGAVAGPLPAGGAYHVIVCRDRVPAKVKPLAEVEPQIRAAMVERRRRAAHAARLAAVRGRVRPTIEWAAVQRLEWR